MTGEKSILSGLREAAQHAAERIVVPPSLRQEAKQLASLEMPTAMGHLLRGLSVIVPLEDEYSEWVQEYLYLGLSKGLLDRGDPHLAQDVLEAIPLDRRTTGVRSLLNMVRHQREASELEASLFPEDLDFESRWHGPHLGGGRTPVSWFPGRVLSISKNSDRIFLELGEPPEGVSRPEIFLLSLSIEEFRTQAEIIGGRLRPDQFLEVHVFDGDQQIFLHQTPEVSRLDAHYTELLNVAAALVARNVGESHDKHGTYHQRCDECGGRWNEDDIAAHEDDCLVGRAHAILEGDLNHE